MAVMLVLLYGLLYCGMGRVVAVHMPEPVTAWRALYFSGITFAWSGTVTKCQRRTRAGWR
jgi:hypothetical protein